ncbi:GD11934 [Drosophila simulans]|uniref:GD11934 n=1 Tax=Drosophila simulans TaxID=7240 RepID=B4NTJ9_DROSI|nr:GD11934 [Drosophila simulans]
MSRQEAVARSENDAGSILKGYLVIQPYHEENETEASWKRCSPEEMEYLSEQRCGLTIEQRRQCVV